MVRRRRVRAVREITTADSPDPSSPSPYAGHGRAGSGSRHPPTRPATNQRAQPNEQPGRTPGSHDSRPARTGQTAHPWEEYAAASAPPCRRRCAVLNLSRGRSSPCGYLDAARADIRRSRCNPSHGYTSGLAQHEREEAGDSKRSLGRAPRDRVWQRPSRPGCLIPCHPVSPPMPHGSFYGTRFTTVPGTRKALSLVGKGPYLRKLVVGAGFEPATSGL